MTDFSQSELDRYDRHLLIPEIGEEGQRRLKGARVLIVGAGGLGAPVIQYLAAAGVGTIGIVDFDRVDLSNLQRQTVFSTSDVGKPKAEVAARFAERLNSDVDVVAHNIELTAKNIQALLREYDIVIDGSDNFETRYVVNDACVLLNKSNVQGAVHRFEGQVSVYVPGQGACYRCIFASAPEPGSVQNCAEAGVLGVLPGVVGSIMAAECLKLILELGELLTGTLLLFEALSMNFQRISVERDPECTACGVVNSAGANQLNANLTSCISDDVIAPSELATELNKSEKQIVLLDVREKNEFDHSHIDKAVHIPVKELERRLDELSQSADLVIYCKSGARSRQAAMILRGRGFANVRSLSGGLIAWVNSVDNSLSVHR